MNEEELNQNGEEMGQQLQQDQKQENNTRQVHPFDNMFFGNRNRLMRNDSQNQSQGEANQPTPSDGLLDSILNNKHLSNVNIDELMTHVDQLIVSLNELKPMFQKVSPLIKSFMQKDKD